MAHEVGEQRVRHLSAPAGARRYDLRDDAIAVGDEHGLTLGGEAHVLAELVLQDFEPDGPHAGKVASRSYFCNA